MTQTLPDCRLLLETYDTFILDLWGVVHNGETAYPGAIDFMHAAKSAGKQVVLLSNAPRRVEPVVDMLVNRIGVPRDAFDFAMTSGEDTWQHMVDRTDPFYRNLGGQGWFLGVLPNDCSMLEGHGFSFTEDPHAAGFVLNTGPSDAEARVEDRDDQLAIWLANKTPMICANPDRVVHKGEVLQICGGAIAERFENMGGEVRWHGKPFAGVYESVFKRLGDIDRSPIDKRGALMVGDSFITDIAGARAAGIHSALVTGGIYRDRIAVEGLEPLVAETGETPTYAISGLSART